MNINKKLIKQNFTKGRKSKITHIVIHDTGNVNPLATALAHYNYFNNNKTVASAHYFVDEKEIVQTVEDHDTAWHCGDGKGKYGITNSGSIGIEICINDGNYTTEIQRTIELTSYLMKKYGVPIENVVRHYDASRKNCPGKLSKNNWEPWRAFKVALQREVDKKADSNIVKFRYNNQDFDVTGFMKDDKNYVGARELLERLGFKVGWEQSSGTVIIGD